MQINSSDIAGNLGWKGVAELYGNFRLTERQYIEAIIRGTYAHNCYSFAYQENEYAFSNQNKEGLYDLFSRITYGIDLGHRNSLTLQAFHLHTSSSVNYTGDVSSWQHFWEGESLLFVEYNQKVGRKFSLKIAPGLSYIQYRLHGQVKEEVFSPRLRFRLVYRPEKTQQLAIGFPIGNGQLQLDQLNVIEQRIDSLLLLSDKTRHLIILSR